MTDPKTRLCGGRLEGAERALSPGLTEAQRAAEMLRQIASHAPRGFAGVVIDRHGSVRIVSSSPDALVVAALLTQALDTVRPTAYAAALGSYGTVPEDENDAEIDRQRDKDGRRDD